MMKTDLAAAAALPVARSRLADYVELTKPRISVLVLFTVAAGYWLGSLGTTDALGLFNTVVATALIASGASALNQLLERHSDARMRRTEQRPLPAGRLLPVEVLVFGVTVPPYHWLGLLVMKPRKPLPLPTPAYMPWTAVDGQVFGRKPGAGVVGNAPVEKEKPSPPTLVWA